MFDAHCHLNFSAFKNNLDEVIQNAKKAGVDYFAVPGTDFESSKRAVEIAKQYKNVYAAVGIHPHHVFEIKERCSKEGFCEPLQLVVSREIKKIEGLMISEKVVAIGEIGIDRHMYKKTKYNTYKVDEVFIEYQKAFLKAQLELAVKHKRNIILHNREAKKDLLDILAGYRKQTTDNKCVFHCCEPDEELLDFAIQNRIFIGVDGDVTYNQKKREFVKKIPLELLVLETDSPFLLPEPLRSQPPVTRGHNEPKNLVLIAEFITKLMNVSINQLIDITTENAKKLFQIK